MSQYEDTVRLISYIYSQNDKYLPLCYKDMVSTQEKKEFALHAFASLMETIELMDNEDIIMPNEYDFTNEDLEVTRNTLNAYKRYLEREEPYAVVTMNEIQSVVEGLPDSVEQLEEFKKGEC